MKKVGIVGLGTITKYYLEGLNASKLLTLVAVCDTLENSVSRKFYLDYPFYLDYQAMIECEKLDYIIISTPPVTHFEIAEYALTHHVNVIVEKPATTNIKDYEYLVKLAKENNVFFDVMYHWQNGSEVLTFNQLYEQSKITEVRIRVLDPYSKDGISIDEAKVKLLGVWIDSGVNILSMLKMWLPFNQFEIKEVVMSKCKKTSLPIAINLSIVIDEVIVKIEIDWRKGTNLKETYVLYAGRQIKIDNSAQCIIDGDKWIRVDEMVRLKTHYYNYFKNYDENIDYMGSYLIHKRLFEVNDKL